MKKTRLRKLLVIMGLFLASFTQAQTWTTIATDGTGDGAESGRIDGTELEYWYNEPEDSLWFRMTCVGISASQASNIGFNVMVNYPGGGSTFNFWGWDNANPFHKLVTGWVTGSPPSTYSGTIGISNNSGVMASDYDNLYSDNLTIIVDMPESTIKVGMLRSHLIPDEALNVDISTAAAVGISTAWNDDIYSAGGTMRLVSTSGISEINSSAGQVNLYPNPAENEVLINWMDNLPNTAYKIEVVDVTGKTILLQNTLSDRIDVSELPSGIYIVKIIFDQSDEAIVSRIIKS